MTWSRKVTIKISNNHLTPFNCNNILYVLLYCYMNRKHKNKKNHIFGFVSLYERTKAKLGIKNTLRTKIVSPFEPIPWWGNDNYNIIIAFCSQLKYTHSHTIHIKNGTQITISIWTSKTTQSKCNQLINRHYSDRKSMQERFPEISTDLWKLAHNWNIRSPVKTFKALSYFKWQHVNGHFHSLRLQEVYFIRKQYRNWLRAYRDPFLHWHVQLHSKYCSIQNSISLLTRYRFLFRLCQLP